MDLLYENLIEPILARLNPEVVVEIGSEFGATMRRLIAFCQRSGATLHAVDPAPRFDASDWPQRYGGRVVFHRTTGLEALAGLGWFDVVLIDGDHNWYTVYHELMQIDRRCLAASRPFPLVMLHDIGWPYGRRDQYYAPEAIPAEFRQPCARKGMHPGSAELLERGGFNHGYWNALREGGPRNGVLTAVEDFLAGSGRRIELIKLPGFHGLGLLVPPHLREGNLELADFLRLLELPPGVLNHAERLEAARIDLAIRLLEAQPPPSRLSIWTGRARHLGRRLIDATRPPRDRRARASRGAGEG